MPNIYKVLQSGQEINRIVASEEFAATYAQITGYKLEFESVVPELEPVEDPQAAFFRGFYEGYAEPLIPTDEEVMSDGQV